MQKSILKKIVNVLKYIAIYNLSAKMITFAIPKLLHMQFRQLHSESFVYLAEVSKFQHMWSFFGRSYHYNLFIGIAEFLIGALVLFPRTRLIALLLSLGVCLNIFVLNIEFEVFFAISHITFDLVITLVLLLEYYKDIYQFFIKLGGKFNKVISKPKHKFLRLFPYIFLVVLSVGYFVFSIFVKSMYSVNHEIVGSYELNTLKVNDSIVTLRKGSIGKKPMLFFEHNSQLVLSAQDTMYVGFYMIKDEKISLGFDTPTTFGLQRLIDVDFNENQIKGSSENNKVFEIGYQRLTEKEDYLNGLYQ
ncbi:hypothetical protein [Aquimarina litoralis]|uniref:hypothetical protein n=1 Tax=Aquimarina litoralis TaxID=584605 RepID=UPI001C577E3D|nr:hypothetical protein [Aquimarina litoralis]MBW1296301.1 hypothetical protein [Aquimarina litoralis]